MELWSTSLKRIGGNFGMGIVAFFLFIKWILFLNLLLFGVVLLFLIVPTIVLEAPRGETCISMNNSTINCCPELYWNKSREFDTFIDFFQVSNLFEYSLLFYGAYSSSSLTSIDGYYYNLPLAYVCVMMAIFAVSLVAVVRSAVKGFRERVVESEGQFYRYCNLVFGGWDYCINNEKASETKHKALYTEIKVYDNLSQRYLQSFITLYYNFENCIKQNKFQFYIPNGNIDIFI